MNEPLFALTDDDGRRQRRFVAVPAVATNAAALGDGTRRRAAGRGLLLAGLARWFGRPRSGSAPAVR